MATRDKVDLVYQLIQEIGTKLSDKDQDIVQENIWIQFSHYLFNGTHYCCNGDIPENVVTGMAHAFSNGSR